MEQNAWQTDISTVSRLSVYRCIIRDVMEGGGDNKLSRLWHLIAKVSLSLEAVAVI